jgi:hypothetical protein
MILLLGCIPALAEADQIYDGKFSYVNVCQNFTEVIKSKGYVQFIIQATSTVNGAEKGTATFLGMSGTVRYFTVDGLTYFTWTMGDSTVFDQDNSSNAFGTGTIKKGVLKGTFTTFGNGSGFTCVTAYKVKAKIVP